METSMEKENIFLVIALSEKVSG